MEDNDAVPPVAVEVRGEQELDGPGGSPKGEAGGSEGELPLCPVLAAAYDDLGPRLDSGMDLGSEAAAEAAEAAAAADKDRQQVGVFVGGLPADATEEELREACAAAEAPPMSLRLSRLAGGACAGHAWLRLGDLEAAERLCSIELEVGGRNCAVQVHHRGGAGATDDDLLLALLDGSDASSVGRLLRLIRSHGNTRAAIGAAVAAVQALPSERGSDASGSGRTSPSSRREDGRRKEPKEEGEPVPDPATYLNSYPRCKQLINAFRLNSNTHNKTPLAILHEYATRLNLEVVYTESAESNLGPFNVEAKLTSLTGSVLYASATGRGRGKKDAKQVAAAGVIEALLAVVPEADFLQPGKAKQRNSMMAYSRGGLATAGRGYAPQHMHSRGRRRPPYVGRGNDYSALAGLSAGMVALDGSYAPAGSQSAAVAALRGHFGGSDIDLAGKHGDYGGMGGAYGGIDASQLADPAYAAMYTSTNMAGLQSYEASAGYAAAAQHGYPPSGGGMPPGGVPSAAGINTAYSALAALQQMVQQQQQQNQQQMAGIPSDADQQRPLPYYPPTY